MKFKHDKLKEEFFELHPIVRLMAVHFEQLSLSHFNKDPVVTRILEHIKGSSGIHEVKRAIDFRNEHAGKFMYTNEEVKFLVSEMNRKFPGNDKYKTCIHHSFNGGPKHFHLQLSSGDKYDSSLDCFSVV